MSINYQALYDEVTKDPANLGYAGKSDMQIADLMNAKTRAKTVSVSITEKTLMDTWDDPSKAEAFMQKLEATAAENDILARTLKWMKPSEGGIDVGNVNTKALVETLVGMGAFTREEADKLQKSSQILISRAEELGFPLVLSGYITKARLQNG